MPDKTPRLGELERQVMEVLWSADEALTTRQVLDRLDGRELAYTTVATVLVNLARKDMAGRQQTGRALAYCARTSREQYAATLMRDALGVSRDRAGSFLHFVQEMPEEDVAMLRRVLDDPR